MSEERAKAAAETYAAEMAANELEGDELASEMEAASEGLSNEELAGQRILEMEAEISTLRDQTLRTHAEMDNLRKRTEREMRDARAYAVTNFAKELLGVADNLDRALQAVPAEARAADNDTLSSLIEGIELTQRELMRVLDKNGVKPIEADGARFDPNLHQAMFEVPNPEVPNNTVVQVVQPGYTIGDRVLRPSMVGVAKGGPKVAAKTNDGAAEPGASVDRTA